MARERGGGHSTLVEGGVDRGGFESALFIDEINATKKNARVVEELWRVTRALRTFNASIRLGSSLGGGMVGIIGGNWRSLNY